MYHFLLSSIPAADVKIPKVAANDAQLQNILSSAFLVIGAITILFIIIGGIRYIVAAGDPGSITRAKDTILYAIIGLVLTTIAFAITQLVIYVVNG
jgi:hypothetical protein